jgi:N-acetylneuraminic acid mutarotase
LKTWISILCLGVYGLAAGPSAPGAEPPKPALEWLPPGNGGLPDLPDTMGYGGPFAGVHLDALIVAGGANFPDGPPWEHVVGGKTMPRGEKKWHDTIYVWEKGAAAWNTSFNLPQPLAYGVSVSSPDGLLLIGGSTQGDRDSSDVYRLKWNPGKKDLVIETLPSLPRASSKIAGAMLGTKVYVAASHEADGAGLLDTKSFLMLDVSKSAADAAWRDVPPWPGRPRRMPVAVVQEDGSGTPCLYLVGGMSPYLDPDGKADLSKFRFFTDGYRFDPGKNKWYRIADLPIVPDARDVEGRFNAARRPVSAACAVPYKHSRILVFSGATGRYILRPIRERPLFPVDVLAYHTLSDTWEKIGDMPLGVVTTQAVRWENLIVIPSGEIRPGVRTPSIQVAKPQ